MFGQTIKILWYVPNIFNVYSTYIENVCFLILIRRSCWDTPTSKIFRRTCIKLIMPITLQTWKYVLYSRLD